MQANMNQSERQQLRKGYILLTLAFIGPFIIFLAINKLWNITLPSWALFPLIICGGLLFVEALDRYESKERQSKAWRAKPKRDKLLFVVAYVSGFGLITVGRNEAVIDSGLSTLFTILGLALIGVGYYLIYRNKRKAIP
jgi:LPXTG-motif cell wall-anchored protein